MLRTAARLAGAVALTLLAAVHTPASDPYIDDIVSAALNMEQGNYDRAVADVNSALTRRSGDPLAHLSLGTLFLHTRDLDRAFKELSAAHNLAKDNPLALYGFALYYLAHGKTGQAKDYFERASAVGTYDTRPALAYVDALVGRYPEEIDAADDLLRAQVSAFGKFKRGHYTEARRIMSGLVDERRRFQELVGAVMTFHARAPVDFTGRPLSRPYASPQDARPGMKAVSGVITLRADLTRAQGVAYVLFYVDDGLIGMTNHSPFECQWDTRRHSNAPHTIRIQGNDRDGGVLTDKSITVLVKNKESEASGPVTGAEAKRAEQKLWDCLRLKPSRRLAYYVIAKCAEAEKDDMVALDALERVVGMDPEFRDAGSLLAKRYSPLARYREIRRAGTKQKIAAITFDDGPNHGTDRLLDILATRKVKATFFVVGSMAEANPEALRRIASEGHQVESHTYSHRNLKYLPVVEIERELVRARAVIRSITGRSSRYFRPPGGHQDHTLASAAGKYGLIPVFWTVNCSKNEGTRPANIVKQVLSETVPGSIILMHNTEDVTLQALPEVIDRLRAKGYRLVTLSELLAAGKDVP